MKKIFWTTIFRFVVILGLAFYMKMFDTNMATGVSTWLRTPTTSGQVIATTGAQSDIMSGINAIQTTLTDMQSKLQTLVGETIPTVTPTPIVTPDTAKATGTLLLTK